MNEVKTWLEKSDHDLVTAKVTLREGIYDASAFYCQQAIEKALKALYIKEFKQLIKTHDLYFLGKKVNLPSELLKICDEITSFYTETRYPDTFVEFEEETVS